MTVQFEMMQTRLFWCIVILENLWQCDSSCINNIINFFSKKSPSKFFLCRAEHDYDHDSTHNVYPPGSQPLPKARKVVWCSHIIKTMKLVIFLTFYFKSEHFLKLASLYCTLPNMITLFQKKRFFAMEIRTLRFLEVKNGTKKC